VRRGYLAGNNLLRMCVLGSMYQQSESSTCSLGKTNEQLEKFSEIGSKLVSRNIWTIIHRKEQLLKHCFLCLSTK